MAKEKVKKEPLTADEKISAEIRKIKPLFKNIDKDRKRLLDKQIYQLAFLQITLDRLTDEVNNSDILEDFVQGSQKFKRENSALKSYNATIKNYISLVKTLCEMLPTTETELAGQALMSFVATPKKASK